MATVDASRLGLVAGAPAPAALRRRLRLLQRGLDRCVARLRRRVDVRSVHQARIAARRLRALLQGFERQLDPRIARPYRTAVTDIAKALEELRDADVAVHQFDALSADGGLRVARRPRDRLAMHRAAAARGLRVVLRSAEWRRRASAMRAAAADAALVERSDEPIGRIARRVLDRRRRHVRRMLRALRDPVRHPRAAHRLRLEIKALRYLAEECAAKTPGPQNREIALLHRLQDCLGDLRDVGARCADVGSAEWRGRCDRRVRALRRNFKTRRKEMLRAWREPSANLKKR